MHVTHAARAPSLTGAARATPQMVPTQLSMDAATQDDTPPARALPVKFSVNGRLLKLSHAGKSRSVYVVYGIFVPKTPS